MLNVAICDDNEIDRKVVLEKVSLYLRNSGIKASIIEFQDGEDLIQYINNHKIFFDIIFIDVYMKFMNGMEAAKKIRESDSQCNIIFFTTSASHAVESYDVRATSYLLKPIDDQKLYKALKIAIESVEKASSQFVIVKYSSGCIKLFYNDILYVQSKARVMQLNTKIKGVVNIYNKLDDFEAQLNDPRFLRCHKSFLINLDYVLEHKGTSFIMENNDIIPISNRIKDKKNAYMDYMLRKL